MVEQSSDGLTQALVQFIREARLADVDEKVRGIATSGFIDTVAVMLAGQSEHSTKIVLNYVARLGSQGDSRVIGSGLKAAPAAAALSLGFTVSQACSRPNVEPVSTSPLFGSSADAA